MTIPNGRLVTVAHLRESLGLPPERPEGTRDLIAVPWEESLLIPQGADTAGPLALGDWPEAWQRDPRTGPRFLVTLRGPDSPCEISGIWETNPARWNEEVAADPVRRLVPLLTPAYVPSAIFVDRLLEIDLAFGWTRPEEKFAFL